MLYNQPERCRRMGFRECMERNKTILMEGSLGERLKREYHIPFDKDVAMAGLIYSEAGKDALAKLWKGYIDIARKYSLPFMATTPTRRANRERVATSIYADTIIADNVRFLRDIQKESGIEMYVGGLAGCKGDAYTAEGALSEEEAYNFHSWTTARFLDAGVDFLYAGIMPSLPEAAGFARAAGNTGIPYIISFTVQRDGRLIDGSSIAEAIRYIDGNTPDKPVCYMSNCVHPSILREALSKSFNRTQEVQERFLGIQANTSPLSYAELDGASDLKCSEPESFADEMLRLSDISRIKIWGGCCGTDDRHIESLAKRLCVSQ